MTIYTTPESFEDTTPSPLQSIASQFGSGLSTGLQILAQDKLDQMRHDRLKSLLGSIGGSPSASSLALLESMIPGGSKPFIEEQKKKEVQVIEKKEKQSLSNVFDELENLNKFTGPLRKLGSYDPNVRENRQKYDSLALALEKKGATMVGKGTLSKERFKFLKDRLPSSNKTQASNKGALDAWKEILDVSPEVEKEEFEFKKVSPGTKLTEEVLLEFKERGLSKDEAKKLARQLGYEF